MNAASATRKEVKKVVASRMVVAVKDIKNLVRQLTGQDASPTISRMITHGKVCKRSAYPEGSREFYVRAPNVPCPDGHQDFGFETVRFSEEPAPAPAPVPVRPVPTQAKARVIKVPAQFSVTFNDGTKLEISEEHLLELRIMFDEGFFE